MEQKMNTWKKAEIAWLLSATLIILGVSLYLGNSTIGIFSAVTGVICVVLTAKGNRLAFAFGLVNVITYVLIALSNRFYGEVMLNGLYYIPMNILGWFMWSKNLESGNEIKTRRLTKNQIGFGVVVMAVAVIAYGFILGTLGGNLPFVDATSTLFAIVAMYLSVNRFAEQWILWIIVNSISIIMWAIAVKNGSTDYATLMMWIAYLANSIWGLNTWLNKSK